MQGDHPFGPRLLGAIVVFFAITSVKAAISLTAPAAGAPLSRSADGTSSAPSTSADGGRVVFLSDANNLVAGQTDRRFLNVFLFERESRSIRRISGGETGRGGDGNSLNASISADGQWIVFESDATDLAPGDVNNKRDIFLYGVETRELRNLTAGGNGDSQRPMINQDGSRIAFESRATNLTAGGDFNDASDVFWFDRASGRTWLVSVSRNGDTTAFGPSFIGDINADGSRVVFYSKATDLRSTPPVSGSAQQVWLRKVLEQVTELVSEGEGTPGTIESRNASISADGSVIAFVAHQRLYDPTATAARSNVFVRVLPETPLRAVIPDSRNLMNATAPAVSPDGARVAFTDARTLYLFGVSAGTVAGLDIAEATASYSPPVQFSADGLTLLVGHGIDGAQLAGPWDSLQLRLVPSEAGFAASLDAGRIYFDTSTAFDAQDLNRAGDIYESTATEPFLVSAVADEANRQPPPAMSVHRLPAIAPRSASLAFNSYSDAIVEGDSNGFSDVFVHPLGGGTVILASGPAIDGGQANGHSFAPALSPDGRYVAFASFASNLVANDTNQVEDVFLKDLETGGIDLITVPVRVVPRNYSINTHHVLVSEGGRYVVFSAYRSDLMPSGTLPQGGLIFVHDRETDTTQWMRLNTTNFSGYALGLFGDTLWFFVTPSHLYRYSLSSGATVRLNSISAEPAFRADGSLLYALRVLSGRGYLYSTTPDGAVQELGDFPGLVGATGPRAALSFDFNGNIAFLSAGVIVPEDGDTQPDVYWMPIDNPAGVRLASGGYPQNAADTWAAGWPLASHVAPAVLYRGILTRAADFQRRTDLYFTRLAEGESYRVTGGNEGPQMISPPVRVGDGIAFVSDGWGVNGAGMSYRPELLFLPEFFTAMEARPEITIVEGRVRITWRGIGRLQTTDNLEAGEWRDVSPIRSEGGDAWSYDEAPGQTRRFFRYVY